MTSNRAAQIDEASRLIEGLSILEKKLEGEGLYVSAYFVSDTIAYLNILVTNHTKEKT